MKATMISRLERLEAQTKAGRTQDRLERQRELEQFQRVAEEHLRNLRPYLSESPENEPSMCCHSESDKVRVADRLVACHIEALRQNARERRDP